MRRILFLLMTVIILTSCSGKSDRGTFIQPEGKVILNNSEYIMNIGEFKWKDHDFETIKTRTSDNYELAGEFSTLKGDKGEELIFAIDYNPTSIIINKWETDLASHEVEVKDYKISLPSEMGYYIYEVLVEWPQGKATYIFDIDVK